MSLQFYGELFFLDEEGDFIPLTLGILPDVIKEAINGNKDAAFDLVALMHYLRTNGRSIPDILKEYFFDCVCAFAEKRDFRESPEQIVPAFNLTHKESQKVIKDGDIKDVYERVQNHLNLKSIDVPSNGRLALDEEYIFEDVFIEMNKEHLKRKPTSVENLEKKYYMAVKMRNKDFIEFDNNVDKNTDLNLTEKIKLKKDYREAW